MKYCHKKTLSYLYSAIRSIAINTIKIITYATRNFLLFALLRNIRINPIKSVITTPSERFIGMINSLVNVPFVTLEKLTITKENIDTKIPMIVRILAYI